MSAVGTFPRPASLKLHTSAPLELMLALAFRKCGLSAMAGGTANVPVMATISTTRSFLIAHPSLKRRRTGVGAWDHLLPVAGSSAMLSPATLCVKWHYFGNAVRALR